MHLRFFCPLFFSVVTLTGCGGDDDNNNVVSDIVDGSNNVVSDIVSSIKLSNEEIDVNEPMEPVSFNGVKTLTFNGGMGRGAFHFKDDPVDEFYTITNRGPNIPCADSMEILGVENFCTDVNGQTDNNGTIFAVPTFTPTIYRFNVDLGGVVGTKVGYEVKETINLRDRDNNVISGLTNPLLGGITENGYDNNGNPLAFDPEGVNPSALVKLSNGTFWLAEEYAPSLVHIAGNGRILERIVPIEMRISLAAANYEVIESLPAILRKRPLNRGIESLAISPDEQFLYFIMESPLANPDDSAFQNSRYVRLFKISLQQGDWENIVGEYVYVIDKFDKFDDTDLQSDVKVSEIVALDTDKLIILERVKRHTKLYRVSSLDNATNILGDQKWDIEASSSDTSLEKLSDLADQGITPLDKKLVFDSRRDLSDLDFNIEGLALLNDEYAVFTNNNDFGIREKQMRFTVTNIVEKLNQ
jgi:hypothetical protein